MHRLLRGTVFYVLVALMMAGLLGCSKGETTEGDGGERLAALQGPVLRIGVLSPMTGDFSEDGEDIVNGVKTAVSRFASGNKLENFGPFTEVEVIVEDSGCDPRQASLWARSLVEAKANIVIGAFCSGATIEASNMLERWGVPMFTPASTHMDVTGQGHPYMFRLCGNDMAQALAAVRFMHERRSVSTLFIVDDGTMYSESLADYVEVQAKDAGIDVLGREQVELGQQDFSEVLALVDEANPDMFYVSMQNADAGSRIVNQARRSGVNCEIMSQDAVRHQRFIEQAWKNADGVYFTFEDVDPTRDAYKTFEALYRKQGYGKPGSYSAFAHDAAFVALQAIRNAASAASDAIRGELLSMDVQGASKRILFKDNGDTEAFYVIQKVENGVFKDIWRP